MGLNKELEGSRLVESESEVHESYPKGSTGHMIVRGERTYLGSVIELPCGHWQGHYPNSSKTNDPLVAISDTLSFRETIISPERALEPFEQQV